MVIVNFTVRGEGILPTRTTCYADKPLYLKDVRDMFPFDGIFHFRQKFLGKYVGMPDLEYGWVDLEVDGDLINFEGDSLDILAIPINIPEENADSVGYDTYYSTVIETDPKLDPRNRPARQNKSNGRSADTRDREYQHDNASEQTRRGSVNDSSPAIGNISLNDVTKAASSIWSSVVSTAASIGITHTAAFSGVAQQNMRFLSSELSVTFSDSNETHIKLLIDLWECLFPSDAFERNSVKWKEAGFQKPDPILDMKTSGTLPLRTLAYFCSHYSTQAHSMLLAQKANTKSNYPFAIVGINISLLLSDVLGLKDQRFLQLQAPYYNLFENNVAFFELFCYCFFHLDFLWNTQKAVRSDFGKIMTELKSIVVKVLQQAPTSLDALQSAAASEGMESLF